MLLLPGVGPPELLVQRLGDGGAAVVHHVGGLHGLPLPAVPQVPTCAARTTAPWDAAAGPWTSLLECSGGRHVWTVLILNP